MTFVCYCLASARLPIHRFFWFFRVERLREASAPSIGIRLEGIQYLSALARFQMSCRFLAAGGYKGAVWNE
jgi:hypothetical protein